MVSRVNVFGSGTDLLVLNKKDAACIVLVNRSRLYTVNQLIQQHLLELNLLTRGRYSDVLRLSA